MARMCPTCGVAVPGTRATYCAACARERDRARARDGQRALWERRRAAAQSVWARDWRPALASGPGPFAYTSSRGVTYYLHATAARVRGGGTRTAYFFAPVPRAGEWLDAIPPGYAVAERRHTGVPYLRRR